jgi:hypothetical protein
MWTGIVLQAAEVVAALSLYFLPAIIADRRKRRDVLTIALFNACLGWTVFGWFVALYWAFLPNPHPDVVRDIMRKRRTLTMRAFSEALAERVGRRTDRG